MKKKLVEHFPVNIFVGFLSQLEYKAPHNVLYKYTQYQISPSWFQDQDRHCKGLIESFPFPYTMVTVVRCTMDKAKQGLAAQPSQLCHQSAELEGSVFDYHYPDTLQLPPEGSLNESKGQCKSQMSNGLKSVQPGAGSQVAAVSWASLTEAKALRGWS